MKNKIYEPEKDTVFVGYTTPLRRGGSRWASTLFGFTFPDPNNLPAANDVYRLEFKRYFSSVDSLRYRVKSLPALDAGSIASQMENIKVVTLF